VCSHDLDRNRLTSAVHSDLTPVHSDISHQSFLPNRYFGGVPSRVHARGPDFACSLSERSAARLDGAYQRRPATTRSSRKLGWRLGPGYWQALPACRGRVSLRSRTGVVEAARGIGDQDLPTGSLPQLLHLRTQELPDQCGPIAADCTLMTRPHYALNILLIELSTRVGSAEATMTRKKYCLRQV